MELPQPWILIAEDDKEMAEFMKDALGSAGFRVHLTDSTQDALRKLKNQAYQCLVLDLRLGEQSAETVVAALRADKKALNCKTPIVVISGHLDTEVVLSLKAHVNHILVKPFDHKALISKIRELCGQSADK